MMEPFADLGARVERAWEEADFDEAALPEIAARALEAASLPDRVRGDDVLRWLLAARDVPAQQDLRGSFAQPPVTVYRGRRFHVQVHFWLDGSTTIHRHGFSGAFQVLDGGSLHARWRFDVRRRVSSHMALGDVRLDGCELLGRGRIMPITPELTHGLFHLDAPSATIVVRSDGEIEAGTQYEYHPPTVAVDPFLVDPLVERQLQVLRLLQASGHPDHGALAAQLAARADLHTVFRVLELGQREGVDLALLDRLAGAARPRHGDAIDDLALAVREGARRRAIHRLRRVVRSPDRRFFLALLQNLPDRDAVYQLVAERTPGADPRAAVLGWIGALSGVDRIGVDVTGDLERILVEHLLDGGDEAALLSRLGEIFDGPSIEAERGALAEHAARVRRTLLAPLFIPGTQPAPAPLARSAA